MLCTLYVFPRNTIARGHEVEAVRAANLASLYLGDTNECFIRRSLRRAPEERPCRLVLRNTVGVFLMANAAAIVAAYAMFLDGTGVNWKVVRADHESIRERRDEAREERQETREK